MGVRKISHATMKVDEEFGTQSSTKILPNPLHSGAKKLTSENPSVRNRVALPPLVARKTSTFVMDGKEKRKTSPNQEPTLLVPHHKKGNQRKKSTQVKPTAESNFTSANSRLPPWLPPIHRQFVRKPVKRDFSKRDLSLNDSSSGCGVGMDTLAGCRYLRFPVLSRRTVKKK